MLRKTGNLGEFSSSEGMCVNLAGEKAGIDLNTMNNISLQTPYKARKEDYISKDGEEIKNDDDSKSNSLNLNDMILYAPSENDSTRSIKKGHPIICVNSENIEDICQSVNKTTEIRTSFETTQPSKRVKSLSSLFQRVVI